MLPLGFRSEWVSGATTRGTRAEKMDGEARSGDTHVVGPSAHLAVSFDPRVGV